MTTANEKQDPGKKPVNVEKSADGVNDKIVSREADDKNHIVISVAFANQLLTYLNSKPRAEVNNFCQSLEKSPDIPTYNDLVEKHYKK